MKIENSRVETPEKIVINYWVSGLTNERAVDISLTNLSVECLTKS